MPILKAEHLSEKHLDLKASGILKAQGDPWEFS